MKRILLLLLIYSTSFYAQNEPFNCDYNAYLFQYNDVYAIDLASGNAYQVAADVTPGNINAAAYNPKDGYIWGSLSSPSKTIVRIGKNFQTTTYYIDELSSGGRYIGDVSATGIYYLKGGGTTYYAVDLDPESANFGKHHQTLTMSQNLNIHDWAFNAVDGFLYTVEKGTNILYRVNAETGNVISLGEVPILAGLNYTYGAVYFDASGRFYVSANQTGTIYVIQSVQDLTGSNAINSNLFAFGPASSQNDGARCPTAPVPQEDCINGIDDDGDGLVDCDDPSCSGTFTCPIITVSASSANTGGLESNNRLSEKISKRNFNRVKNSYKFDVNTAKKVKKSSKYGKKTSKNTGAIQLEDLVPLGVVSEDSAIESSPNDLIGITNATNVYSVDYIKNNVTAASILLLETQNGVYEHTKVICDRLLGAEIISVSTIEIREQAFIKTLFKNVDGGVEFVLSLAAKNVNNGNDFEIESHWNIDKYQSGASFYNFQIWANSLDDLYRLGDEVLNLLEVQKPIVGYNNSTPPTVFIKKGKYHNGKLDLQIVNTNRTQAVTFDAGVRASETETVNYISSNIDLSSGSYISNVEVDAGTLFDVGFRIGDGVATPDDLFLSDGSWGYDDADATVTNYAVEPNTLSFDDNQFAVERNLSLEATTNNYVAAYRSLTAKFSPVNLTAFDTFNFEAKGTGNMVVRLVKEDISNWEEQYKVTIPLTNTLTNYSVPFNTFLSSTGAEFEANDVVSIVFTMLAYGAEETKKMDLKQLHFSKSSLSDSQISEEEGVVTTAVPNPMFNTTNITFTANATELITLDVFNQDGRLVKQLEHNATYGNNQIKLDRGNLSSGLYFCKINSKATNYKTVKLIIE
ncbi:T9SS type A sorting domain-containing protein [Seonamhaeicola algicola]|uniref:T9SS type A sorting domain-containing protein n=1 Tax=Seonamhaeicola algicola TaxID=1719036 RepID=A0A5C7B3H0_9FLAO|nr:T9SS type A sorting domain-containing protein [Seonamhaeicola algicola]TXE14987.1 T9SS type A sorting domain-containing protein [Seonamhaeicola algicola]